MFAKSKPFIVRNLKSSNTGIFRVPVVTSTQSFSISEIIAASEPKSKLHRSINSLAVTANSNNVSQVQPSGEDRTPKSHTKNTSIVESLANFCFPSQLFSRKNENENEKKLRLKKIISNAEDLLNLRSNDNWTRRIQSSASVSSSSINSQTNSNESSSQFTLEALFEKQASVISSYVDQLSNSNHPLVYYASNFYQDPFKYSLVSSSIQLRSLTVMLVAKAIGLPAQLQAAAKEIHEGIETRQRALSEITELIYAAHLLHRTVVDVPKIKSLHSLEDCGVTEDEALSLHQGNKLATLMGDFLLAKSSKGLSALRNAKVTELMSDSIADITESEFVSRNNSLMDGKASCSDKSTTIAENTNTLYTYDKWLQRTNLSIGSLLGHSCYCTMVFSGHEDPVKHLAFHLGSKIAFVLQVYKDLNFFLREENTSSETTPQYFDLWSLPVIFQLEHNPSLIRAGNVNYAEIYEEVKTSQVAISRTREALYTFQQSAARLVSQLPESESSNASKLLSELVLTLS